MPRPDTMLAWLRYVSRPVAEVVTISGNFEGMAATACDGFSRRASRPAGCFCRRPSTTKAWSRRCSDLPFAGRSVKGARGPVPGRPPGPKPDGCCLGGQPRPKPQVPGLGAGDLPRCGPEKRPHHPGDRGPRRCRGSSGIPASIGHWGPQRRGGSGNSSAGKLVGGGCGGIIPGGFWFAMGSRPRPRDLSGFRAVPSSTPAGKGKVARQLRRRECIRKGTARTTGGLVQAQDALTRGNSEVLSHECSERWSMAGIGEGYTDDGAGELGA